MEVKESNKGDITLEMLQREFARVKYEPRILTVYCRPKEVPEAKVLMEKIFGK